MRVCILLGVSCQHLCSCQQQQCAVTAVYSRIARSALPLLRCSSSPTPFLCSNYGGKLCKHDYKDPYKLSHHMVHATSLHTVKQGRHSLQSTAARMNRDSYLCFQHMYMHFTHCAEEQRALQHGRRLTSCHARGVASRNIPWRGASVM
jgi:hypothetical protein